MNRRQFVFLLALFGLAAAGTAAAMRSLPQDTGAGKPSVVASFYPLQFLAEEIGGDGVSVKVLIPPGVDPHSWQPSAGDVLAIADASTIVYNGAGLDAWMEDNFLPIIDPAGKTVCVASQGIQLIANTSPTEIQESGRYDPHTWVSPYTALAEAENIYNALLKSDPAGSDGYTTRWLTLKARLSDLDARYTAGLSNKKRSIIFTTHEAFGYLARGYGFEQYGVVGLSADQEPSTDSLAALVEQMIAMDTYVFYLEPGYSDVYVQTVTQELSSITGRQVTVLKLYHMNGPNDGLDYLSQMESNLTNLVEGLTK